MCSYFDLIFYLFVISQCFQIDAVNIDRKAILSREKRQTSNGVTREKGADKILQQMDGDGDGRVSEAETYHFITVVNGIKLSKETIAEEFKAKDLNHDGYLSALEIDPPNVVPVSNKNTTTTSPSKKVGILKAGDKDGNGVISLAEAYEYFSQDPAYQLTKPALETELKFLDKNHDGVLSASELDPVNSSLLVE